MSNSQPNQQQPQQQQAQQPQQPQQSQQPVAAVPPLQLTPQVIQELKSTLDEQCATLVGMDDVKEAMKGFLASAIGASMRSTLPEKLCYDSLLPLLLSLPGISSRFQLPLRPSLQLHVAV